MTTFDWQTLIALMCVAAAAVAVILRLRGWLIGSHSPGCGSACQSCPAKSGQQLVQIQSFRPPVRK